MALADTARLVASLELQDKFSRTADSFDRRIGQMDRHVQAFGRNVGIAAAAGIGFLGVQVTQGIRSLQRLEEVTVATEAVIESTGGVAGISAQRVRELAEEFESLNATMDDKVIQSAENVLLTFTAIGEDVFPQALEAALNMNEALGGGEEGLQGTIIQLGKALQDPIRGITALRRVGVNFSASQQETIANLVEENRLFDAQQIILSELATEFGGQFAAAGDTATARFAKFRDAIEDTQMQLASAFLPVLEKVADKLTTLLADPAVQARIVDLGENLAEGFDALVEIAGNLPWEAIGSAFELMGTGAKALLTAFQALPPWVQTAVLTGWGLNKITGGLLTTIFSTFASGIIKGVLGITAGVVNINAGTVTGGGGAVPAAGAAGSRAAGALQAAGNATTIGAIAFALFSAAGGEFTGEIRGPLRELISEQKRLREKVDRAGMDAKASAARALSEQARLGQASIARLSAIERKNFSPTVRVTSNITSNVSITDVTRRLVSQRISIGGTGGITIE